MIINDENARNHHNTKPSGAKAKSNKGKSIEETYTKKTQLEHILLRPDTYVGSVDKQTQPMWVLDNETKRIVTKQCSFVPGLYKIFDEIIVNASDNKQRDPTMSRIEVTINPEENFIRVWNNGSGIPVAIHQEHGVYVPELIFGNLLTGSNFDDNEAKTTGGRNGFGAKLANIFSTKFIVETYDNSRNLKYHQEFTQNMTQRKDPVITKSTGTDFTCVTFYPDLKRFKMDCLDDDIVSLLSKRVYDMAGTNNASGAKLNVYLNGNRIESKNFEQYICLYQGIETPAAFERINDYWEIGVGVSDGTFQQVSFVNSICTTKGGCHVNYIADQITQRLMAVVKKKNKGEAVKAHQIKNHLSVFVNSRIVNPAFDSQTKENLTTASNNFGSTCVVSDKLMKIVEKSGIIDSVLNWAKFKQTAELKKKGGSKRSKIIGITKLDDANHAGTSKSNHCTLILTEGDSAKALAISGLGVVGRDYYGVFPLKGKLLNVREASHAQIMKNEEIQNISKILGLTFGKEYTDVSSLRYGHLMIMTDQDHDGSHIKGLLINFLHHFWPSLLRINGFLQQFITPIVKCMKGKKELTFFTIPEYQNWRQASEEGKGWRIKYYKGLGTSTAAEAKEYFSNLRTHEIDFVWDDKADDMIDMAFAKKRVEDRKLWLLSMEAGVHIDYKVDKISYDNFVNHELILFSHADNERSIAHFMDGLKPSQRKVLYACFKRNLKQEIKVAQLAGYISEHSAYHHGEASLTQTIIGMAQNFIGSNNINLLSPCGQFGTRLMGGKDAASPRYVFTKLESITRLIYHPHDDPILEYLDDDGQTIEPLHYVPIIPMALVNGSEGIGTGWSSSVPTYNPRDIIHNLKLMLSGEEPEDMQPWFRGFSGQVVAKTGKDSNNFSVLGKIEQIDECTVIISELPVGRWTTDYKQYLESVLLGGPGATAAAKEAAAGENGAAAVPAGAPFIKDFKENHTDTTVLFTVTLAADKLTEIVNAPGGLMKKFKLEGSCATSNMHMFDLNSQIRKFDGPMHVMADFFTVRLRYYDSRKMQLTHKLTEEWEKLDNKMRFVLAVIREELIVSNRKKQELLLDLKKQGFKAFFDKTKETKNGIEGGSDVDDAASTTTDEDDGPQSSSSNNMSLDKGYDYLLTMKIWSLTMEKVQELIALRNMKRIELDELIAKTAEMLWLEDLSSLEKGLDDFEAAVDEEKRQEVAARKKAGKHHSHATAAANKGKKTGSSKSVSAKSKKKQSGSDDDNNSSDDDDDDSDDDMSDFEEVKKKPRKPVSSSSSSSSAAVLKPNKTITASNVLPAASKPTQQSSITKFLATNSSSSSTAATSSSSSSTVIPASKPLVATKVTKTVKPPTKATAVHIDDDDEDDDGLISATTTLSLLDRLKANSATSTTTGTVKKAASSTKAAATKKAAPILTVAKPNKNGKTSSGAVDLCDEASDADFSDDDDDDIFSKNNTKKKSAFGNSSSSASAAVVSNSRAPRAAAVAAKKKYVIESDEEDDDDISSAEDDDDAVSDSAEEDEELAVLRGGAATKKAPLSKKVPAKGKVAAKSITTDEVFSAITSVPVVVVSSPQKPTQTVNKGVKRIAKSSASTSSSVQSGDSLMNEIITQQQFQQTQREVYSPGFSDHPVPAKKPRAIKPTTTAAATKQPKANSSNGKPAAAVAVTSKAKTAVGVSSSSSNSKTKKSVATKKSVQSDDDEDDGVFEIISNLPSRSPKPVRARKPIVYTIDDDDEEEEEEEEAEESDFSDDED